MVAFFLSSPAFSGEEPLRSFLLRETTIPRYTCRVLAFYPHDPCAFTQGLVFWGGALYESTGLYGESSLRRVDLRTGEALEKVSLEKEYFAEGITVWGEKIIQLTWESRVALVYERDPLKRIGAVPYPFEGWGITSDGESFIASDGSEVLRFLDPVDFNEKRRVTVRAGERKIDRLNELEYIEGKIYANIWYEDLMVIIDPQSGRLTGWIDLADLVDPGKGGENVLNGIAYDPEDQSLLVTGKRWHRVYRVRVEQ